MAVLGVVALSAAYGAPPKGIELHAHLFMKDAMTWAFDGDFFGELRAKDWRSKLSSQANPEAMEASMLSLTVVALYAHPLFTFSMRDSVRRQIAAVRRFVVEHPHWVVATTSREARLAIAQGKKVLVLSLEGAAGVIETEEDAAEFIDQDGVSIVTPLHLTDDQFGGVAFLKGWKALSSPLAFFRAFFTGERADGLLVNGQGLTVKGRELVKLLVRHKAWVDLSHASDLSQREVLPLLFSAGQPILHTHTSLRRYLRAERGISREQLQLVKNSAGIIGLMPSEEMLEGTPVDDRACKGKGRSSHSFQALALQWQEALSIVGRDGVALGSDYNGGIRHLPPACATGTSLDQSKGLWNIGQSSEIWTALKADPLLPLNRFLKAWAKIR